MSTLLKCLSVLVIKVNNERAQAMFPTSLACLPPSAGHLIYFQDDLWRGTLDVAKKFGRGSYHSVPYRLAMPTSYGVLGYIPAG